MQIKFGRDIGVDSSGTIAPGAEVGVRPISLPSTTAKFSRVLPISPLADSPIELDAISKSTVPGSFPQQACAHSEERPFRIALPTDRLLGDSIPPNERGSDIGLTRYARKLSDRRLME
jgi:hypothetical protein